MPQKSLNAKGTPQKPQKRARKACKRTRRDSSDEEEPPAKKSRLLPDTFHLADGRMIHNAEWVILDKDYPDKYPHLLNANGDRIWDPDELCKSNMENGCKNALDWLESADVIRLHGVSLKDLNKRSENVERERTEAQRIMEQMEADIHQGRQPIHCFSTRVVDKDGELLVGYFSHSPKISYNRGRPKTFLSERAFDEHMHRNRNEPNQYHGLSGPNLDYIAVATQDHLGTHPPRVGETDVRHNNRNENRSRFPPTHYHGEHFETFLFESATPPQQPERFPSHGRPHALVAARDEWKSRRAEWGPEEEKKWYAAPVGVKHLDRLWYEQGQKDVPGAMPVRSGDLLTGSAYKTGSAMHFMQRANLYVQELLLPKVLASFPEDYEKHYRSIFRIAALNEDEERRPGFHTGHVIVHNQPVHQHMDGDDSGFCATFCTGSFDGGYVVFADLGLVFRYRPGDVLLFRSRSLYHGVTTWTPRGDINPLGVMPGRTSHVLYTKKPVMELLGQGSGSVHLTNAGKQGNESNRVARPGKFTTETDPMFRDLRKKAMKCRKEGNPGTAIWMSSKLKGYLDKKLSSRQG